MRKRKEGRVPATDNCIPTESTRVSWGQFARACSGRCRAESEASPQPVMPCGPSLTRYTLPGQYLKCAQPGLGQGENARTAAGQAITKARTSLSPQPQRARLSD